MKAAFVFLFCLCSFFFQWIKKDCCFFLFRIECIRTRQRLNDQFVKLKFPFISFDKGHALHMQFIQASNYHYARIIMRKNNLTRRKTRQEARFSFFLLNILSIRNINLVLTIDVRGMYSRLARKNYSRLGFLRACSSSPMYWYHLLITSSLRTRHIDPMRYSVAFGLREREREKKKSSFRITIVYL